MFQNGSTACLGLQPVIDGVIIPDDPFTLRQAGDFIHVPEMIGLNRNDAFLFVPPGDVTFLLTISVIPDAVLAFMYCS